MSDIVFYLGYVFFETLVSSLLLPDQPIYQAPHSFCNLFYDVAKNPVQELEFLAFCKGYYSSILGMISKNRQERPDLSQLALTLENDSKMALQHLSPAGNQQAPQQNPNQPVVQPQQL